MMTGSIVLCFFAVFLCFCTSPVYSAIDCQNVTAEADIVLVVDRSNSISISDFKLLQSFLSSLAKELVELGTTRVALVTYGNDRTLEWNINDGLDDVRMQQIINGINRRRRDGSNTRTYDALDMVKLYVEPLTRPSASKAVVLFTDGESNGVRDAMAKTIESAGKLKTNDTTVIAVGIGSQVRMEELVGVSSDGKINSTVLTVSGFDQLTEQLRNIIITKTICIKDEKVCTVEEQTADIIFVPYSRSPATGQSAVKLVKHVNNIAHQQTRIGVVPQCQSDEYSISLSTPRTTLAKVTEEIISKPVPVVADSVTLLVPSLRDAVARLDGKPVEQKVAILLLDKAIELPEGAAEFQALKDVIDEAIANNITVVPMGVGLDSADFAFVTLLTQYSGANLNESISLPADNWTDEQLGSAFSWLADIIYERVCTVVKVEAPQIA